MVLFDAALYVRKCRSVKWVTSSHVTKINFEIPSSKIQKHALKLNPTNYIQWKFKV